MIRSSADRGRTGAGAGAFHAFRADPGGTAASPLAATGWAGLRGGGGADRFCAWAGRSGRRVIFAVSRLDAGPVLPAPVVGALVLAVRRPLRGARRVVWAASVETEAAADLLRLDLAGLAGSDEVHVHMLPGEAAVRAALLDDLGYPAPASLCRAA